MKISLSSIRHAMTVYDLMAVYVMQFGLLQHARAGQPLDGATLLWERLCAWPDLSVPAAAA